MDTTAVILNWKRSENLKQFIIPSLEANPRIREILVVNNNVETPGVISISEKVKVFEIGRDHGLDARFSAALFARTPLVLIQDDDLVVYPSAIDRALDASLHDTRIHGIFGRRPTPSNKYASFIDGKDSEVEMVITRFLTCKKDMIQHFFSLRDAELIARARALHTKYGTNPENGEDIIFSYALRAANFGALHCVHQAKFSEIKELQQFDVAQCQNPRFGEHRTLIMRACQEATGLF